MSESPNQSIDRESANKQYLKMIQRQQKPNISSRF